MSEPCSPPPLPFTPKYSLTSNPSFGDGSLIPPKRGGIDPIYGIYLGCAPLDDCLKQTIDTLQ